MNSTTKLHSLRKYDLLSWCLALCIASLPFSYRLNSLSIILVALAWLYTGDFRQKLQRVRNPLFVLFSTFYLLHIIGMLWTDNISRGFFELEKKSFLLVFPLLLGTVPRMPARYVRRILFCFVGSCLLISVICLAIASYKSITTGSFFHFDLSKNLTTYYFFYFGLTDPFSLHPGYLAMYIVFCFTIVADEMLKRWDSIKVPDKILGGFVLCFLITMLLLLSSRIMLIAFIAVVFIYFFYKFVLRGRAIKGIIILVAVLSTGFFLVMTTPVVRERFERVFTSSYTFKNDPATNDKLAGKLDDVNMRLAKLYFAWQAGKDAWLLGNGTGDEEDALMLVYYKNKFWEGYYPKFNAHNQFLQTWIGLGIPGVFSLLISILIPAYLAVRQRNGLYFILLFTITMFFLTESVFARQHGVSFFAFFNSLFAFHSLKTKE